MRKKRTIDSFYKLIEDVVDDPEIQTQTQTQPQTPKQAQPQTETQTNGDNVMKESLGAGVEPETIATSNLNEVNLDSLIRDPGVRPPISSYPSNLQDEIRRTYMTLGPYQLIKSHYPLSPYGRQKRSFQAGRLGSDTFIVKGFNKWRKVNSGKECPFANHEEQEIMDNRLRLQVTIDSTKWFTLQTCPLRGDTKALTWKNEILSSLSYLKLDVQDIRGLGYDGASNMRGEWNGLKSLILSQCPFAYYVHCFAHQLQLALVAASKDVSEVHTFLKHLNFIVNVIGSSTKRNDQLQDAQIDEISHLAKIRELGGGRGSNQMQNLQRAGETRWSSHFKSICSLLRLFGPTRVVLDDIYLGRATGSQKGDAKYALTNLLSFDFVLVLHLMKKIMGITDKLFKALQNKSQDIVNALTFVSTTKTLIQELRDDGWKSHLDKVVCFCEKYNIPVLDMNVTYKDIIQSCHKKDNVTVEHHYRVDVFIVAIDSQLQELNNRFTSKDVSEVHTFFKHLNFIVNVISSSTKWNDQLQDAQIDEISHLAKIGELEGGRGSNQMQNLQRAGDTRWSSHFKSICSLLRLFGPTRVVLNGIYLGRATCSQEGNNGDYRQALQNKSQDIVNALTLVSTTKTLIQELRDDGCATLDPRKSFNSDDICKLVTKYYPLDFTDQDKFKLKLELQHYELDNDPKLKNVTSLSQLCKGLQETEKSKTYPLIDRLIRLILTLPVSTATSKRAFSKMKLVKTRLRSTMSDGFLKSSMILSVEREIVRTLCTNNVTDDFYSKTQRRVQLKKRKFLRQDLGRMLTAKSLIAIETLTKID
nr:hypothetical protein [Tanacetum cinerariifolium]